jgi:hypothetical protein
MTAILILIVVITKPTIINAGGYFLTDKDGYIISESSEKTVVIGPTEKTIVLYDYDQIKAFEIQWDADEKTLVIKGDNVHLKVFRSGKIEKWSAYTDTEPEQYPLFIEPVVPIFPQK